MVVLSILKFNLIYSENSLIKRNKIFQKNKWIKQLKISKEFNKFIGRQ